MNTFIKLVGLVLKMTVRNPAVMLVLLVVPFLLFILLGAGVFGPSPAGKIPVGIVLQGALSLEQNAFLKQIQSSGQYDVYYGDQNFFQEGAAAYTPTGAWSNRKMLVYDFSKKSPVYTSHVPLVRAPLVRAFEAIVKTPMIVVLFLIDALYFAVIYLFEYKNRRLKARPALGYFGAENYVIAVLVAAACVCLLQILAQILLAVLVYTIYL
jgi:hypothetical protein